MSIRILIADDHTLFREMLRETLAGKGNTYAIVGEAADGGETLNLVTRYRPDLLLLDYRMPGLHRLSAFCQEVTHRSPNTRTLLVTGFREDEIATEAAVGGAQGYILKGAPIADLLIAIGVIHAGGIWVDSNLPRHVFHAFLHHSGERAGKLAKLTLQELNILSLASHVIRNDEIGSRLYISKKTVKNHLTHILAKLGVGGRQRAVSQFLSENNSTPPANYLSGLSKPLTKNRRWGKYGESETSYFRTVTKRAASPKKHGL